MDGHNPRRPGVSSEVYLCRSWSAPGEAELIARKLSEEQRRRWHSPDARPEALHLLRQPKEAAAELTENLDKHPEDVPSYEMMGMLAK